MENHLFLINRLHVAADLGSRRIPSTFARSWIRDGGGRVGRRARSKKSNLNKFTSLDRVDVGQNRHFDEISLYVDI